MILYRALSTIDKINLEKNDAVVCTLRDHRVNIPDIKYNKLRKNDKACLNDYDVCFGKYSIIVPSLDCIIGHIEGGKLKSNNSPWISTSTDFNHVVTEYAIPQAGNYNNESGRRTVIAVDYNDNMVYDTAEKLLLIRNKINNFNFAVDLRNGKLNEYYEKGAISLASCNPDLYSYNVLKDLTINYNGKNKISGFAGYATVANEVLVHGLIKAGSISLTLSPFIQDILYGCNIKITDVNKAREMCYKINDALSNELAKSQNQLLKELYPNIKSGNNLTDYLSDNYNDISGNSLEDKYQFLKNEKIELLKGFVKSLNLNPNSSFKLVDDKILVSSYDNIKSMKNNVRNLYDILIIEKDGLLYKYNSSLNKYINEETGNTLDKIKKHI